MKSMREPGELNNSQQRRLRVTCEYSDKLLGDTERVLHSTASQSPFPRYVADLTPAQARVIEDHIRRLRAQLLRALAWQHMRPNPPDIPATQVVRTNLAFIDIAIEELKPRYMGGFSRRRLPAGSWVPLGLNSFHIRRASTRSPPHELTRHVARP
jgi:hypothetical protein